MPDALRRHAIDMYVDGRPTEEIVQMVYAGCGVQVDRIWINDQRRRAGIPPRVGSADTNGGDNEDQ